MALYRFSALALMAAVCASCESDGNSFDANPAGEKTHLSDQNNGEALEGNYTSSAGPVEVEGGNTSSAGSVEKHEVRELNVASEGVTIMEHNRYFGFNRYGPTQKLFHFENENAVLQIVIGNQSESFQTKATVHIFESDTADGKVAKWINNQVSDGIYADAPEPTISYDLSSQEYQVTDHSAVGHFTGENGDEYEGYVVNIYVDNIAKENIFYLTSFVTEAEVYVQTKDIDPALVP